MYGVRMGKVQPASFGERLKAARERAGLSRYALARRSGISQPGLAHYEADERAPNWDAVQKIRLALECAFEDLADPAIEIPGEPTPKKRGRPAKKDGG